MNRLHAAMLVALPCVAAAPRRLPAQSPAVQRIRVAEDARGHGADGVTPLLDGLRSPDTMIRRIAVRAIGRLQESRLAAQLLPMLNDRVPAIRAAAADALAQAAPVVSADVVNSPSAPDADSIAAALGRETDPPAGQVEADALGRLPYGNTAASRVAEGAIAEYLALHPGYGAARGLYSIALRRGRHVAFYPATIATLRQAALQRQVDPLTRRMALLALTTGHAASDETLAAAFSDSDEQVRRLAVAGSKGMDSIARTHLVGAALRDPSAIVRIQAITILRPDSAAVDCAPIIAALGDSIMYVRLTAIDGLSRSCTEPTGAESALRAILAKAPTGLPAHGWQEPSHALVALAHVDAAAARPFIASEATASRWEERMYAARAAMAAGETDVLARLVHDADHNVVEAAIDGLHARVGHGADSFYIDALRSDGHQSVRAAALALRGSRDPVAKRALVVALQRLTATQSDNTRDPRVAILESLAEMSGPSDSGIFVPWATDYDPAVATLAARTLTLLTGRTVDPRPAPVAANRDLTVRTRRQPVFVTVRLADSTGGGQFVVRLFADDAPATVARIERLIASGYYNGHAFHRVEPDFVVQGGGNDASEYAGDSPFMRDEVTTRPHARGTLGVSTRGRDTGDAQWFINLVDNPRLDHDYTVFGEIVSGRDVAERIQEGDVIAMVSASPARR